MLKLHDAAQGHDFQALYSVYIYLEHLYLHHDFLTVGRKKTDVFSLLIGFVTTAYTVRDFEAMCTLNAQAVAENAISSGHKYQLAVIIRAIKTGTAAYLP